MTVHPAPAATNGKLGTEHTMFDSSKASNPSVVEGSAVGKTDQYAHDGQRLRGDNTTAGKLDPAKGTRGNSKQASNHGSLRGRPETGVGSAPKVFSRGTTGQPQGPAGHPPQHATSKGAGVRGRGNPGR